MSLFGALMGELDEDPFMGGHMRRMNTMMNSFFRDPFADMVGRGMGAELMPFGGRRLGHGQEVGRYGEFGMNFPMMPMGFPNIGNMFQTMGTNPNCHSFSSSTVMTMTPGPDGRPQIYQASQSVKQGPNGVRETKKSVSDTRTGVKKLAIGHHILDRGHIIEREQNVYSGEQEERQDFINLDEEEADSFNKEWETKARSMMRNNAIDYAKGSRRHTTREPQLALPSTAPTHNSSRHSVRSRPLHYSSSIPSTSTLLARSSEEDDDEGDDGEGEVQARPAVLGGKRKISTEVISSDDDDDDEEEEPLPKKIMTARPKAAASGPTPSSSKLPSSSSN